jgi:predicted DNA-binding antitoxin AbrB/MazE fold protein
MVKRKSGVTMATITAVYENGVFKPTSPVDLPENTPVEFEPRVIEARPPADHRQRVFGILSRSYETGDADGAARHDDHQP